MEYKQIDIANWLSLSPPHISLLFQGERSLSWKTAQRVARLIGTKPEKLMTTSGPDLKELLFKKFAQKERIRLKTQRGRNAE
jgi:plasmid maintenance system antidote protein VapI